MTDITSKKIVFVCRALSVGGAERQLLHLATGLQELGHTVAILTFYKADTDYPTEGMKIIVLAKKSRWDIFSFMKTLHKTIRAEHADVIYSFLCVPNILMCLFKAFRLVRHERIVIGFRGSFMKWSDYGSLEWLTAKIEAYAARFADVTITNSQAGLAELLRRGFKTKQIYVVPNGINTDIFKPDVQGGLAWRARHDIPLTIPLVAIVARLDPMKDHKMFLQMAKIIYAQNKTIYFTIIGSGKSDYTGQLNVFQKQIGLPADRVYWIDCDSDINYNAFNVVCSTSAYGEGFSNVLCEALSSGIPCFATNVGDARIILNDDRYIVEPGDAVGMSQKVSAQLGATANTSNIAIFREKITGRYAIEKMTLKTERFLFA